MIIYLDMDGVLCDFHKRYEELYGMKPLDRKEGKIHFYKNWNNFIATKQFETLDLKEGAIELMKVVNSFDVPVEILSSSGGEENHKEVTRQKLLWLASKNITYKPNIVPGSSKKAAYAKPWHILIDDTDYVIDSYLHAGGTAIHHVDYKETIKRLHELHLEWRQSEYILS